MKAIQTDHTDSFSIVLNGTCALLARLPIVRLYRAAWPESLALAPTKQRQRYRSASARAISHDHDHKHPGHVLSRQSHVAALLRGRRVAEHREAGLRAGLGKRRVHGRSQLNEGLQQIRRTVYATSTQRESAEMETNANSSTKIRHQDHVAPEVETPAAVVLDHAVSHLTTRTSRTSCVFTL